MWNILGLVYFVNKTLSDAFPIYNLNRALELRTPQQQSSIEVQISWEKLGFLADILTTIV